MIKILITLGLTLAASTAAFGQSTVMDAYHAPSFDGSVAVTSAAPTNDLISYDRAGNDGSPVLQAPQGGIDYTATAFTGGGSTDRIVYDRAGNDGSPRFK